MSFVADLDPNSLWTHFDEILAIPRPSKGEEKMRKYVLSVADRNGLEHSIDPTGNVIVRKPATAGNEKAPVTVVQAHLDMVQEKNSDVDHDFAKDPIAPQLDGDYLKATGTTLGADNGIGVASMLALIDAKNLPHGPLELLFTMDEETGMTGAGGLDGNSLKGRLLLNVDSEEEGELTIGCAGGADTHLYLPLSTKAPAAGSAGLKVRLADMKGGHSGIDIHLQRGNAIKLLTRALYAASLEHKFLISELAGGNAHNAIPREASATLATAGSGIAALEACLTRELEAIQAEYRPAEPTMQFTLESTDAPAKVWDETTTGKAMMLIGALPHGVIAMSYDIPGLVETSTNFAAVSQNDGRLSILLSSRSSVTSALPALRQRIRAIAALAGADVDEHGGYPAWQPDVNSALLQTLKQVSESVLGYEPKVGAIHAGLECSIIGEKYAGMDMISFGPTIEFPHSPDERVKIDTVGTFYKVLAQTLERIASM
jgi:dipeptidase D